MVKNNLKPNKNAAFLDIQIQIWEQRIYILNKYLKNNFPEIFQYTLLETFKFKDLFNS